MYYIRKIRIHKCELKRYKNCNLRRKKIGHLTIIKEYVFFFLYDQNSYFFVRFHTFLLWKKIQVCNNTRCNPYYKINISVEKINIYTYFKSYYYYLAIISFWNKYNFEFIYLTDLYECNIIRNYCLAIIILWLLKSLSIFLNSFKGHDVYKNMYLFITCLKEYMLNFALLKKK